MMNRKVLYVMVSAFEKIIEQQLKDHASIFIRVNAHTPIIKNATISARGVTEAAPVREAASSLASFCFSLSPKI